MPIGADLILRGLTSTATTSDQFAATGSANTGCSSDLWNLTLTILLTPCSSIVTPYNTSAMAIVRLLCVMIMNCECARKRCKIFTKRTTLDSSSGASNSSSTQNVLGLT